MKLYRIENNGVKVDISPIGASIVNYFVKDKSGEEVNIVLGYDDEGRYLSNGTYIGAVVGPIANRVDMGCFNLDGVKYQLSQNDGTSSLHGGDAELNSKRWEVIDSTSKGVTLTTRVHKGEGGYPCDIVIQVSYFLNLRGELYIRYTATPQARCPINLTQHVYFNLNGTGDILDHELFIDADCFLPVNKSLIPVGVEGVEGTPFDFRNPTVIGDAINKGHEQIDIAGGFDHCWCLNGGSLDLYTMDVYSEKTGIKLRCKTDLPGVQFYSGNFLDEEYGRGGEVYNKNAGLCLETQHYPNLVNTDGAEGGIYSLMKPFISTTIYKASAE